jgi:hypothetical protein
MNQIGVFLNSNPYDISNYYDLVLVRGPLTRNYRKLGFLQIKPLLENIPKLKYIPVLFESVQIAQQLELEFEVIYLDCIKKGSYFIFKALPKKIEMTRFLTRKFNCNRNLILKGQNLYDNSLLGASLYQFLKSLPVSARKSIVVSLAIALSEKKPELFLYFLDNNRMITDVNKKEFLKLRDVLNQLYLYLKGKAEIKEELKSSLPKIQQLLVQFGNQTMTKLLDKEENIV